ncbi:hypothetical protein P170DRAFT_439986 [Aspergillus steynii IBT 23096]|uniref:Uncharacterized protein n=1 Tax=Aspergillus steynii IBT 23096 TaxID=1392250 RepID=A0A2I2FVT7_9EURO|nr:uncharacterized protein P170DRAFT_439986 [Aspergillus steynii IBT 23096]PLB44735.1 hypothetical protein P170DRAFT_439986 [Aspergillus steynii IBT 23096]
MVSSAMNRFRIQRRSPSTNESSPGAEEPHATEQEIEEPYFPDLYDVLKTRHILRWKVVPGGLPLEIVDMIVDAAEYWASVVSEMRGQRIIRQDGDQVLVRTSPLCYDEKTLGSPSPKLLPHRTIHPCRKIIFFVRSHDQGWGGGRRADRSPFQGSNTWFDVEVVHSAHEGTPAEASTLPEVGDDGIRLRAGHPLLNPSSCKLQSNRTYVRDAEEYTITWHYLDRIPADSAEAEEIERAQGRGRATLDGSQVCTLGLGDAISVWGRARYGGWTNYVEQVSVRVFWAV